MSKRKVYYLIDPSGKVETKFVDIYAIDTPENKRYGFAGILYTAEGWLCDEKSPDLQVCDWDFLADLYIKLDGCSHWRFFGEDYYKDNISSYYHLCGFKYCERMFRAICFAWKLAKDFYNGDLLDINVFQQAYIDQMLKCFTIECVIEEVEDD